MKAFAKIAALLHAIAEGVTREVGFKKWDNNYQNVSKFLKKRLTEAPKLGYTDFNTSFIVKTDSKIRGLGAYLSQEQSS